MPKPYLSKIRPCLSRTEPAPIVTAAASPRVGVWLCCGLIATIAVAALNLRDAHGADPTVATKKPVDFAHSIVPILKKHCAECHAGHEAKGGFSFNTRGLLLEAEVVTPGTVDNSRLWQLITSQDAEDQMPPKDRPRLNMDEVDTLRVWIEEGLQWDEGINFAASRYEPPLRPRRPELPPVTSGRTHPIDRIIDAYLVEHKIPQPQILDDATYLRRVSMDLVGLPPTVDELTAFLAETSVDKRAHWVRHLLNQREAYATHWLTFWNDLLRNSYSGTGFIDDGRSQVTQWLYQALLANKPYDQFVRELIAPVSPESAGFVKGIKWRGNVNASQVRELQFAQNVGQVFLGINMKCASCHDSFIDRWKLDEAYGLAAVVATEPLQVHRCDKPVGRVARAAWIFPELGQVDPEAPQPERLRQLSELLTHPENGRLARTVVNRIWHRMMGRGIVHPVDAMQSPPWHADLLDFLATYLVDQHYDLQKVCELIATSQAYQARSVVQTQSEADGDESYTFRGPVARRLTAEQFLDNVWFVTNTWPEPDKGAFERDGRQQGGQLAALLTAIRQVSERSPLQSILPTERVRECLAKAAWIGVESGSSLPSAGDTFVVRRRVASSPAARMVGIFSGDNEWEAHWNGRHIAGSKDWQRPVAVELTNLADTRNNTLAIKVVNGGSAPNPSGFIGCLVGFDAAGDVIWQVATDESWRIQAKETTGWERADLDDAQWLPAHRLADANAAPWSILDRAADVQTERPAQEMAEWGRRHWRAALQPLDRLQASLGRPNREQVVSSRPSQLTTLEGITLSNDPRLAEILQQGAAQWMGRSVPSTDAMIHELFRASLSRSPTSDELQVARDILGEPVTEQSLEDLLWNVFMLPEFQWIQ